MRPRRSVRQRASRAGWSRALLDRSRGRDPDARERARRDQRPGLEGLEAGHRSRGLRSDEQPAAADLGLLRPRALLARGDEGPRAGPVAGHRRGLLRHDCGCATAWTPAPSTTRTATSSRRSPTSAGSGSASRCWRSAAWLAAAARVHRRARRATAACPGTRNASGVATLAAVVVIFGLHSTIDWTWFVPGNVVPALLCAGWVASRPRLRERLGDRRAGDPAVVADGFRGGAGSCSRSRSARPGVRSSPSARRTPSTPRSRASTRARSTRPRRSRRSPTTATRSRSSRCSRWRRSARRQHRNDDASQAARPGDRPRARQPGDLAAAGRVPPGHRQRPQGRAEGVPGRALPRSEAPEPPVRRRLRGARSRRAPASRGQRGRRASGRGGGW